MTDKVQKIREEVEKCYNKSLERSKITDADYWEGKADAYRNVLVQFDSLQEEPVGSMWYDKNEEPCEDRQVLVCLSGNCYVDFYHKEDKRFYMFGNPRHYLCEVDKWAYIDDILNLSNVERTVKDWKEPVSEDLEEAAIEYCGGNKGSDARVRAGFIMGAEWHKRAVQKKNLKRRPYEQQG